MKNHKENNPYCQWQGRRAYKSGYLFFQPRAFNINPSFLLHSFIFFVFLLVFFSFSSPSLYAQEIKYGMGIVGDYNNPNFRKSLKIFNQMRDEGYFSGISSLDGRLTKFDIQKKEDIQNLSKMGLKEKRPSIMILRLDNQGKPLSVECSSRMVDLEDNESASFSKLIYISLLLIPRNLYKETISAHPDYINFRDELGFTPLHLTAYSGNTIYLRLLLDRGANINIKSSEGWTPLHGSAYNGKTETCGVLLEKGADIGAKDKEGWTPLHIAVYNDQTHTWRFLLEKGADINEKDKGGWTPLHSSACYGKVATCGLLIQAGADIVAGDNNGKTPLHLGAVYGQDEVCRLLIEKGADINAKDNDGWTPLHNASFYGETQIAKLLLDKGADPHIKTEKGDQAGKTPLTLAKEKGYTDMIQLLLQYEGQE